MKVCFIGIGSIARRHIKNLRTICLNSNIELSVDGLRRNLEEDDLVDHVYTSFEQLPSGYDAIFITNPTDLHIDTLIKVQNKSRNFFIEKPLISVQKLSQVSNISLCKDNLYYVACPLRYTKVIQYLKEFVKLNKIICVRVICSSYLPEWRPNIDYRNCYSAHKEQGGGVSIDLIHEWDYLKYLFGSPIDVMFKCGKKSQLAIDSEDTALYIAEYEDMFLELHLDYYGRKPIREIMLFTEEDTVVGDLINSEIRFLKSGKVVKFSEERDDYQIAELEHFIRLLDSRVSDNDFFDAYETLLLTQGILNRK